MVNKTSNNQQQKETTGNGQRKEKVEEQQYSDSDGEQQGKDGKIYKFRSTSTRAKIEAKKRGKEDNINSVLAQEKNSDINNRDRCMSIMQSYYPIRRADLISHGNPCKF